MSKLAQFLPGYRPYSDDLAFEYCVSSAGLSPLRVINLNDADCARRLLQLCLAGNEVCDVSRKFQGDALLDTGRVLSDKHFQKVQQYLEKFQQTCESDEKLKESGWKLVLFRWEAYAGQATREVDFGELVFADKEVKNFLLVEIFDERPGDCSEEEFLHSCNALLVQRAQRFYNLLIYLRMKNGVGFVRATYTTQAHPILPDQLLGGIATATASTHPLTTNPSTPPPIIHLHGYDGFVPCLSKSDLKSIDSLLRWTFKRKGGEDERDLVLAVPGRDPPLPSPTRLTSNQTEPIHRVCGGCLEAFPWTQISRCSGCSITFYCSKTCQTGHWKKHKILCQYGEWKRG